MKITDKRSQFQNNEEVDKKPTEDMSLISKIISGISLKRVIHLGKT